MKKNFSIEQTAKTVDLNADLMMRQNISDKMAKFMKIKSINPKLKQSEIAKDLAVSISALK